MYQFNNMFGYQQMASFRKCNYQGLFLFLWLFFKVHKFFANLPLAASSEVLDSVAIETNWLHYNREKILFRVLSLATCI